MMIYRLQSLMPSLGNLFLDFPARFFVPTTEDRPAILSKLMQRYRLLDIVSRS
ncbi:hypothetical protein [Sinorhizobium alkalisoli]|uniref:hypothetical protein n=1 Tax=Sinorhizobium alkalisoli TaxID=1752398 RepID=UPI0012A7FAF8|nr:hypothetical protein [Sinorhizobium alkalisoli]MCA1493185.1 hypothetical protein [Ensifer sp. NBAIM29]MCG5481389.1 hypothetical protein [Sinorhizobium alkalisoli]QFI69488.1 hypothetical protein EKH55_4614 [Sinorhizobium alkalisoli]